MRRLVGAVAGVVAGYAFRVVAWTMAFDDGGLE